MPVETLSSEAKRPSLGKLEAAPLLVSILLPLSMFGTVVATTLLYSTSGGSSWVWLPIAIMLAALLRNPVATWPYLLGLGAGSNMAANLLSGFPLSECLLLGAMNTMGPCLVAVGLRRFAGDRLWYVSGRWLLSFVSLSVLGAALLATVGSGWYVTFHDNSFSRMWPEWFVTNAMGFLMGTPFLLSWTEPALRRGVTFWKISETAVLTGLVFLVSYLAFTTTLPLLVMVFPFLAIATIRGGLPGATAGTLVFATVAIWSMAQGIGPIATLDMSLIGRGIILRGYFLTALITTLPVAIALNLREMMTEKLRRQDAISGAALNNMAQGLCMYDVEDRLVICNQRHADLYGLPEVLTVPGTPLAAMLDMSGDEGDAASKQHVRDFIAAAQDRRECSELELADGRIVEVQCRALEDGGWIATHEDVTERRRASHRIAYLATHDPLTNLPNRAFFAEQLQRSLALAERGHSFALHSLDLDRFKAVNDTLGHAAGDELLRQVAERLRKVIRNSDLVTRLGGDEFAIIQFPLERPKEADMLAARVVEALAMPYDLSGHEAIIGGSVGIALAPREGMEAAELLQKSDLALYRAKTDGRNTYCFFEAGMDTLLHKRRVLESELRAAIQKGEFELHYQPIVNVESGAISGLEALVRWNHPTRGLIMPAEFISVAEETGLIIPIGEWVLRHACREAAGWPGDTRVAINLSPVQFRNRNLPALILHAISSARLAPRRLELEITESVLLQNSDEVLAMLHQLRDAGISISMDDFGTGYSSLSYLRSFPFDKIKIDQSFVRDLATKDDCLAIIHATTQLSGKLGIRSVAEGVETAEQLALLRAEGCTEVQGYYINKPVPAQDVKALLGRHARRPKPVQQQTG